jgi:hypothetical protein
MAIAERVGSDESIELGMITMNSSFCSVRGVHCLWAICPARTSLRISRKSRKPTGSTYSRVTHGRYQDRDLHAASGMEDSDSFDDALNDIDAAGQLSLCDASASFRLSEDANLNGMISPSPLPPPFTQLRRPYATSLKVFRRHMFTTLADGSVQISAERLISRACYEDWLSTRSHAPNEPEKTFQRILTSCVTGTDGRTPFTPAEEAAVLWQIRQKRVWPAFVNSPFTVGIKGFRSCVSCVRACTSHSPSGTASTKSRG